MDDIEHSNTMIVDVAETSIKKRPRKQHIYSQILQQMEFYFSNANLSRDRYLNRLLEKNKYVPLEVFLTFNKISALTGSTEEIAQALGSSQILKLTDDGKHVYRASAVKKKDNQDDCIIYVEQLPPDANHDWVIGIFSAYGKVEYVSIPKYKNKAAIKGFAFVEFDTPEAAKKALEAFGSAGCCLPPEMQPEELCSIVTYQPEDSNNPNENDKEETDMPEKQTEKLKKNKTTGEDVKEKRVDFKHEGELIENEEPKSKKLKIEVDEHQEGGMSKKKIKKKDIMDKEDNQEDYLEDNASETEVTESARIKKGKKRKFEIENADNLVEAKYCSQESSSDVSNKKKKKKTLLDVEETAENEESAVIKNKKNIKKKHQAQNVSEELNKNPEEMEDEFDDCNDLQQPKKSKKKKRCEAENDADKDVEDADDEGTSERSRKQTEEDVEEDEENDDDNDKTGAVSEKLDKKRARKRAKNKKKKSLDKRENDPASLGLRIISKEEWRRLRNKYLNLQREKMQGLKKHLARVKYGSNHQSPCIPFYAKEKGHQIVKKNGEKKTKYMPGIIIHIELAEPLGDVNAFKTDAKSHPGIEYVDATAGNSEVHIRCGSAEVAQKLIGAKPWDNMEILQDDAEKKYWEKIWEDRKDKMKSKVRVNIRGREKLLKRAERELGKHIKFDD